jgi:glucokinase
MSTAPRRHLGIDLGGTNCKWVVLESAVDDWRVLDRGQVPTAAADGPDAVVGRFIDIGRSALRRWPELATVGIGVPGLYDPSTGHARFLVNFPGGWRGVPIGPPVQAVLDRPTALINDARAFGLAELRLGAGRGASSLVGMVLGTGVGGVIAIDGKVHLGHDGTAGELGHQTIDPDGPSCNCGNHGCLEAFARADRIAEACGTETVEAAVLAAHAGDERARAGLTRVGTYLGVGIANVIAIVSPDRVVIGGGVAAADSLLLDPMRAEIARRVTTTALTEVEIVPAELGTWAGAIGAGVHGAEAAA